MSVFKVYQHPTEGYDAVKDGFSWPAFFFGIIWMLVKKLWIRAALWFGMYIGFSILEAAADESRGSWVQTIAYVSLAAAYLALWLAPGFRGNKWREEDVSQRGYKLVDVAHAETPEAAIARVLKADIRR